MTLAFSDKEASILLGATLMHWGVPFRGGARRALTELQQTLVDEASDKLVRLRESYHGSQGHQAVQAVLLSDDEAALLVVVVEDCLKECGNDAAELGLQLKTKQRDEVEALLQRLRDSIGLPYAKPA